MGPSTHQCTHPHPQAHRVCFRINISDDEATRKVMSAITQASWIATLRSSNTATTRHSS